MKEIFFILFGVVFALPCELFAQKPSQEEEVEFGIVQLDHLYVGHLRKKSWNTSPGDDAIDNMPIKWLMVNHEGLFHTSDTPEAFPAYLHIQSWDSLYYATRDYLTFNVDEFVYKYADTTRVNDVQEDRFNLIGKIKGAFINGVKEGLWEKYAYVTRGDGAGKVVEESYKNGVLHGMRIVYNLSGARIHQTIFVDGTGNYADYFYDTGKIAVTGFLVYGKRHGRWQYYNKEGKTVREEFYKHGLLHGPLTIYDDTGNVIYDTHFVNGTGAYRAYRNDVLKEQGQIVDGRRVGDWSRHNTGFSPQGFHQGYYSVAYKEQDPINDDGNVIDVMFYDGDYITIRATRDE